MMTLHELFDGSEAQNLDSELPPMPDPGKDALDPCDNAFDEVGRPLDGMVMTQADALNRCPFCGQTKTLVSAKRPTRAAQE